MRNSSDLTPLGRYHNVQMGHVGSVKFVFFLNLLGMKSSFLNKDGERGTCFSFKWHKHSMIFLLMYFWNKCVFTCLYTFRALSRY